MAQTQKAKDEEEYLKQYKALTSELENLQLGLVDAVRENDALSKLIIDKVIKMRL